MGSLLSKARTKASIETQRLRLRIQPNPAALDRDRLARTLRDDPNVLFLCTGNVCRSPLAERYLRAALDDRPGAEATIDSAGIRTEAGRSSPETATTVADEFGVDLTDHRSTPVTRERLAWSDATFVMDMVNYHHLRRRFGERDVYFLGALADGEEYEIYDPYGSGEASFRRLYGDVVDATDEVAALVEGRR